MSDTSLQEERDAQPAGDRIPALDGLRGIAILLVLVYHFFSYSALAVDPSHLAIDRWASRINEVGWTGVDLFFVLSGFLITGILYDAKTGSHFFRNFYARRVLRIFPVYYGLLVVLIVALPLVPALSGDKSLELLSGHQVWYWTYLFNIWIALHPLTDIGLYGQGHIWSLAIEEQFYLVWPLVVFLFGRRSLMAICGACIVGALAFRIVLVQGYIGSLENQYAPIMLTPARMDALALGGLIALVARGPGGLATIERWAWPLAAAMGLVIATIFVRNGGLLPFDELVQTLGFSCISLLFAALLLRAVTALPGQPMHRLGTQPVLTFFGRYSYALYVFHLQIVILMTKRMGEIGTLPTLLGSAIPMRLAFSFVGISMAVTTAWLSWHLWEKQFLKLKRYFPSGERRPSARTSALVDAAAPLAAPQRPPATVPEP